MSFSNGLGELGLGEMGLGEMGGHRLFIGFPNVWKEEDNGKLPWAGQTQYQGVCGELPSTVLGHYSDGRYSNGH